MSNVGRRERIEAVKAKIERLIESGCLEEAKEALKMFRDNNEEDAEICSMKAVISIMEGSLQEAEAILFEGVEKDPIHFDLLFNLAYINEQKGQYQKAANFYSNARDVSNESQKDIVDSAILGLYNKSGIKAVRNGRILHGTMEIANQMYTLTRGLRKLGVKADAYNFYPSYLGYKSDFTYNFGIYDDRQKVQQDLQRVFQSVINSYSLFHFHFGTSLLPDNSDLPILAKAGKKTFMHYWGSDVRLYSKAVKLSKYVKVKTVDEDSLKRKMDFASKHIDNCIVADYELYEYVKPYYNKIHFIPVAIDLGENPIGEIRENVRPIVVHAPTSPEIKGTEYVIKAVEELKQKIDFEFILVRNQTNERAKAIYRQADIIVDQLLIGCYGVFAVESMAMGKPVISWISEFMQEKYPKDLPIVSANPDNIRQQLEMLLKDKQLREKIGLQGRKYVEKYHDMNLVSKKLLHLYQSI